MNPIARLVLVAAYAVLGIAATGRASFQVATKFAAAPGPYAISAASAALYILIAVAIWQGWNLLALCGTAAELLGVLTVGTLGIVRPEWWADETVWTGFGSAYGWAPLILPALAMWALLASREPATKPAGARRRSEQRRRGDSRAAQSRSAASPSCAPA